MSRRRAGAIGRRSAAGEVAKSSIPIQSGSAGGVGAGAGAGGGAAGGVGAGAGAGDGRGVGMARDAMLSTAELPQPGAWHGRAKGRDRATEFFGVVVTSLTSFSQKEVTTPNISFLLAIEVPIAP